MIKPPDIPITKPPPVPIQTLPNFERHGSAKSCLSRWVSEWPVNVGNCSFNSLGKRIRVDCADPVKRFVIFSFF